MNVSRMPHISVSTHYENNQSTMVQTEIHRDSQATTEIKTTTATRTTSKITREKRRIENEIKKLSNEHDKLDQQESLQVASYDPGRVNIIV
jgi:hypothetical protein